MSSPHSDRREFLSGSAILRAAKQAPQESNDLQRAAPPVGATLQLTTRAMACDFSVVVNGGEQAALWKASIVLDAVHEIEQQLSVYRAESEVSRLNLTAHATETVVAENLLQLLLLSQRLAIETDRAFDLTSGPLIQLWRRCRSEHRVPQDQELDEALQCVGMDRLWIDQHARSVRFERPGVQIEFGAIGKGYALDTIAERLKVEACADFLVHGGRSSLRAAGQHVGCGGWPVGIGNPLLTDRRLGTIILQDEAMSTSGSNIQYFRIGQQRYGHILDPRTGWPANGCLSVIVIAPSAAVADALSTAYYVMGPEKTGEHCQQHPEVGVIVIPFPSGGRRVRPEIHNLDADRLFWDHEQVAFPVA